MTWISPFLKLLAAALALAAILLAPEKLTFTEKVAWIIRHIFIFVYIGLPINILAYYNHKKMARLIGVKEDHVKEFCKIYIISAFAPVFVILVIFLLAIFVY